MIKVYMDDKTRQRALLRIHYFDTVLRYMPEHQKAKHKREHSALLANIMPFFVSMQRRVQLLDEKEQIKLMEAHGITSSKDLAFYIALAYTEFQSKEPCASDVF